MTAIPESIGRFDVRSCLGTGGMGVVYLAVDRRIDRLVAVKVLRVDDQDVRDRFLREARAAGRLQHANIVTIFEVGDHDGQPFIAMEYISGETLAEMVTRRADIPVLRKLELIQGLCQGLGCAHQAGIIHRDVKPANLMVNKTGILKILDFGVARLAEGGGTTAGIALGTPAYMSPEQIEGEAIGIRSDIFAVGAVLYELLVYQKAFAGETYATLRHEILNRTHEPLARVAGVVHPALIEILRRALARQPQDRYPDLNAMHAELARAAERLRTTEDVGVDEGEVTLFAASPFPAVSQPSTTPRGGVDRKRLMERRAAQIAAYMSRARRALAQTEFEDARAAADAASLLDPDNPGVLSLLEQIQAEEDGQLVRRSVDAARDRLVAGDFTEARRYADEALRVHPENPDAQAVRREVETAALAREAERERARTIADSTQRAREAMAAGAFDMAIRAADEVLAFDPVDVEASAIKAQAVQAVAERKRQVSLDSQARSEIESARIACEAGHHTSAIHRLEQFTPEHPLIRETLAELRQEVEAEARRLQEEEQRHAFDAWFTQRTATLQIAVADERWRDAEAVLEELRARGQRMPEVEAFSTTLGDARRAAVEVAVAGCLEHARALFGAGDLPGALARTDEALALDEHHNETRSLRADIQQAVAQTETRRREAAVAEAVVVATSAVESQEFDRARECCEAILAEFPGEPQATAMLARIRQARRSAALHGLSARAQRLAHEGRAAIGRTLLAARRGLEALGPLGQWMRTRTGQLSALAAVVVLLGGVWWAVGSGSAPAPRASAAELEAESFLQRGDLVQAAETIEQALADAPEDEGLVNLAGVVLGQARLRVTEARQAAAGTARDRLAEAEASAAEAEQLSGAYELAAAARAFGRTVNLYREAVIGDASLAQLVTRAREHLAAEDLTQAAEFGQQARLMAPADATVVALSTDIWVAGQAMQAEARANATAAGGASLGAFGTGSNLEGEAVQRYEEGDLVAAIDALFRSASAFGDAAAAARGELAGRSQAIVSSAQALLDGGQLVDAASETARGLDTFPSNRELRGLAAEIRSTAATAADTARAAVPAAGQDSVGDAEALRAEAASDGDLVSAVGLFVEAAAGFRAIRDSVEGGVNLALEESTALLGRGELEQAARRIVPSIENGRASALARQVGELVKQIRDTAAARATEARQRARSNAEHPAFEIASEQERGGHNTTQPLQLPQTVEYFRQAVRYFDEAAAAAEAGPGIETLLAAWETAWEAKDGAALERLYPNSPVNLGEWREESPDRADWTIDECDQIRLAGDTWQTVCRGSIVSGSTGQTYPFSYDVTVQAEGNAWVFQDFRASTREP